MKPILDFIKPRIGRLFNSKDHTLEVHLAAFGCGILAFITWLTIWVLRGPRDANLVAALVVFAGAITGGLFKKGSANGEAPKDGEGGAP
jgi:hypothetical protein